MRRIAGAVTLCLVALASTGRAQDAQYWTQKYGTRSLLLSGVVIGSAVDISTSYYNPAGMALLEDPGKVLTVKAFDFSSTTLTNGAGPGINFGGSRSSILPTFFGGTVPIHFLGSQNLGYSLFPRQLYQATVAARTGDSLDVFPALPGNEPFAAEVRLEQDLTETWAGITWSRRFGSRLAVGVSQYVAVRSQSGRRQLLAQAIAGNGTGAVTNQVLDFDYNQWGTLTKLGVAATLGRVDLGLTVTTPTIKITTSGNVLFDQYLLNQDLNGDGIPDNQLAASYQKGVSGRYRTPLSIGAGGAFRFPKTTLYVSGEWFDAVPQYDVLDVAPVVDQVTGNPVPAAVTTEARSVFNVGGGVEHRFGGRLGGFASFATDQSSLAGRRSSIAFSTWNIDLVTAGVTFGVGKSEFSLGGGYSWGAAPGQGLASFGNPSVSGGLVSGSNPSDVTYHSIRIIVGFAF